MITGNVAYYMMVKDNKDRTLDLMHTAVIHLSETLDVHIKDIDRVSQAIQSDPVIQRIMKAPTEGYGPLYDADEVEYRIFQYTYPWSFFHGIYIFTEDDRLFFYTKGTDPPAKYNVSQEPWINFAPNGVPQGLFYWPTGPETTVQRNPEQVFSVIRVVNDIGMFTKLGYLKLDVEVSFLESLFVDSSDEYSLRYLLIDKYGNIMFDNKGELTSAVASEDQLEHFRHVEGSIELDNTLYMYTTEQSNYNGWTIVSLVPQAELLSESNKIRNTLLLIGIFAMLVITILSFVIASNILKPLSRIITTMRRVEAGDYKVRLDVSRTSGEMSRLSNVFNLMLDSVNELIFRVLQTEIREKDAQLQALQAQINPHMLFNTLNIIKAMGRKHGAEDISQTTEALAEMFRYSIGNKDQIVTLEDEIHHVENYIALQQARFPERVRFLNLIPSHIYHIEMLRLSLQPLVENAIIHGIENLEQGGEITLSMQLLPHPDDPSRQDIELCVADTGVGLSPERLQRINQILFEESFATDHLPDSRSGLGLLNIQKRIQLSYGIEYGISLDSSVGNWTRVYLKIPFKEKE